MCHFNTWSLNGVRSGTEDWEEEALHDEGGDLHQCRGLAHEGLQGCGRDTEAVREAGER